MSPRGTGEEVSKPDETSAMEITPTEPPKSAIRNVFAATDPTAQLKWYYSRLFPIELFCRWLSYGSDTYLSRREVSLTLAGDIYLRYRSYKNADDLLESLKSSLPIKIDIGAVYNYSPKDKGTVPTPLTPLEKELVFDIDMTDYADVIGNGAIASEVEQCDRNWALMGTAVKVMTSALREDFGFKHIMWVYSGRRGIHCWVADERARSLNNEQRSAIAEYLYLRFQGGENAGRRQYEVTAPLHPALMRAKQIACEDTFRSYTIEDQGMLDSDKRIQAILNFIPPGPTRANLESVLLENSKMSGAKKWARIEKELHNAGKREPALRPMADYLIFHHTYPRLDVNVSKEINHLLKAPFCVHPKTGRVCVPFDPDNVDSFIPGEKVPTMAALMEDLGKGCEGAATNLLNESIKVFENFIKAVETETRLKNRRTNLQKIERNAAVELVSQF